MNLRMIGATYLLPSWVLVPTLATEWVDDTRAPKGQKRRPPTMVASFCPFCGVKIDRPKEDQPVEELAKEQS